MRILFTCGSPSWGGLEMLTVRYANDLKNTGQEVALMCSPDTVMHQKAMAAGLPVYPVLLGDKNWIKSHGMIKACLKDRAWNVVHVHMSHDLLFVVPALKAVRYRNRFIMTKHMGSYIRKKDMLHRYLYRSMDMVLAISHIIRKNVIDTCPVDPRRVFTHYYGLPLSLYQPGEHHAPAIRRELGIPEGRNVVGIIGRMTPGKGHFEFLHAARKIIAGTRLNPHFLIVGSASHGEESYESRVRSAFHEAGLESNVTFTGFRSDIPRMLAAMDILTFPSHSEAFGFTLLEAMAMKRAIAAFDSDAVPEIVTHQKTGLLVPPRDADALADAVIALLMNRELRYRLGEEARRYVEASFSLEIFLENLHRFYTTPMETLFRDARV